MCSNSLASSSKPPPPSFAAASTSATSVFAFARAHHPAMKHVASARTALAIPTIFNVLGPLTNPGRARHQLLGVFSPELTDRLASVLRELGSDRAWVVHADDGLDELSTLGPTRVSELNARRNPHLASRPARLRLAYARLSDLQVRNAAESAEVIRRLLAGEHGPTRDIAILNAAAAMVVAGKCQTLEEGLEAAGKSIDGGAAKNSLEALVRCSREG